MSTRLIHAGRAVAALIALCCMLAAVAPAQTDRPLPIGASAAALEPLKASLDSVEAAVRDARDDRALADAADRLAPLRDGLRREIATLEPRLAEVDNRLKQLGDAPPPTAAPEAPALAAERTRLTAERAELDTALKQVRLLALRGDQLAERIGDLRRALVTGRLFARSPGLLDPAFWRDAAGGLVAAGTGITELMRTAWTFARVKLGTLGVIAAALVVTGVAVTVVVMARAWRRRLLAWPAETRFARAFEALVVFLNIALVAPILVIVALLTFESLGAVTAPLASVGYGIAVAAAVAGFGRGAGLALFAPTTPARRLAPYDDSEAHTFSQHLSWATAFLGLTMVINAVLRTTAAPAALMAATNALLSLALVGVGAHLLAVFPHRASVRDGRLPGLRAVLWLFITIVLVALVAGYAGFASFVAGRFVAALAMLCALYVVLVFIDALLTEVLTGDTEVGRSFAALFGITPRGLELIGTLLSAALRIVIVLIALPPVLGPWGLFATDIVDFLRQVVSGFRVAGITISLAAIVTAFVWLVLGVLAARGVQRWLETRFMPRTGIDPSLQQSVATLIGYALVIAAIALALGQLGIEAQQIALVAGALSVGIGFGLQSVVSNFVSGIILLAERPIRVGDWVVVKNEEGIVRRISVRATEIETFDRASVIIPNSDFISGPVKNLTHSDTMGRITVKVRATYDSDIDTVRDLLIACACEHPQVLQTQPPRVYLIAFGDIALELELRCIVANVNYGLTVRSDLQMAILQRFRAAGIKMPVMPHEEPLPGGARAAPKDA
jgi:small-conductance mechanosensitive channel